jgi:hypothetical protein
MPPPASGTGDQYGVAAHVDSGKMEAASVPMVTRIALRVRR